MKERRESFMNEEKMMILKMLEEGKITSEEAARLLESLKGTSSKTKKAYSSTTKNNQTQRSNNVSSDWLKDLEPKIQNMANTMANTASSFMDKLAKTVSDSDFKNVILGGYQSEREVKLDLKVTPSECKKLILKAKNDSISLKGYNGDYVSLTIFYKSKEDPNLNIQLVQSDNNVFLRYDQEKVQSIRIEGFIPESVFYSLQLESYNGKVCLETCKAHEIKILTSNATVDIREVDSQKLSVETSNAAISTRVYANELVDFTYYNWSFETSNAPIKYYISSGTSIGYQIQAVTSLNKIQVNIPNLTYTQNEENYVEAHTLHYDLAPKKIDLKLTTSNSPIILQS